MIKKAVIPVAGLGTRFLPATKAQPKEMLPIVDKPVIQYIVEEAVKAGIKQIIFITGKHKRAIEDHFDSNFELEYELERKNKFELLKIVKDITKLADIVYVRQRQPLGLGHAILMAESVVGNEPFAVLLGDEIIVSEKPAIKVLMETFDKYKSSVLGVKEVKETDVSRYGIIDIGKRDKDTIKVDGIVEKPDINKSPSNIAVVGRYIFTPNIFKLLRETPKGKGGEVQLTDAIAKLIPIESVYAKIINGKRFDTGSKLGFLEATVEFALQRKDIGKEFKRYLEKRLKES